MSIIIIDLEADSKEELQEKMKEYLGIFAPQIHGTFFHTPVPHNSGTWTVRGERFKN